MEVQAGDAEGKNVAVDVLVGVPTEVASKK